METSPGTAPFATEIYWKRTPGIAWPKWALAVLFLADGAGFGTWAGHVAVFKQNLHLTNGSLTYVLISIIAGAILTMPIMGHLIAHHGSRRPARVMAVVYFSSIGALGLAPSLSYLIPVAFLFGMSRGTFDVAVNAQVIAVENLYRRSYQGLFQGSWSAGGLLGAGVASIMLHSGGTVRHDMTMAALVLGSVALACLPFLTADPIRRDGPVRFIWPDSRLLRVGAIAFFGIMAEGSMADWASVYLHSKVHVSLSLAAIGYAAFSVTMALSRFSCDWTMHRFSPRQILGASGICIAAGTGIALAVPAWWPAITGFVIAGIGTATIVPVTFGIAGRSAGMGPSQGISTVSTIGYFGLLAEPPLIGSLAVLTDLRFAMLVVVLAGLFIAIAPRFLFAGEATGA